LPRSANYDDFEPLEHEPGVHVRFVDRPEDVADADLAILPGSKSTMADLAWLRESGIAASLVQRAHRGDPVMGICGGCQMLTEHIDDREHVESTGPAAMAGLGLLDARTRFSQRKTTARVVARPLRRGFFARHLNDGVRVEAYEIHMGSVEAQRSEMAAFEILERTGQRETSFDGAVGFEGAVVGTMLHGLFENDDIRAAVLRSLRSRRGLELPAPSRRIPTKSSEYDRLASALRGSIDPRRLMAIVGL